MVVGAAGVGIEQGHAGEHRTTLGADAEGAIGIAQGKAPGRVGACSLEKHVGTAVTIEIADHVAHEACATAQHRRGSHKTTAVARGHQAVIGADTECSSLNRPAAALQAPVAAQGCSPGIVRRCRHIGTGDGRQLVQEGLALVALAHIAAVEQQITIGLQRRANALQGRTVLGQIGATEPDIAHLHRAVRAVRQQVDSVQPTAPLQVVSHLLQTVLAGIQDYHLGIAGKPCQQFTNVGHLAVHKHHFLALGGRRGSLGASLRFCGQCMPQCAGRIHGVLRRRSVRGGMRHIHRSSTVKHKALLQCQRAHRRGRLQALGGIGLHCLRLHGLSQTVPEWARFAGHQSVLPG